MTDLDHQKAYEDELAKLQDHPETYMTPGARRYFTRVWIGYAILALAISVGLWRQSADARDRIRDINTSRALISYTTCLDQNERHDATVNQIDKILIVRKAQLRKQIKEADARRDSVISQSLREQIDRLDDSRSSTVALIDALAPHQNCKQIIIDRFGSLPDVQ